MGTKTDKIRKIPSNIFPCPSVATPQNVKKPGPQSSAPGIVAPNSTPENFVNTDAVNPLVAGLKGRCAKPNARLVQWTGEVLTSSSLSREKENARVEAAGGAVILPYGDFDPKKPVTLLVHGMGPATGEEMLEIAEAQRALGQQVFILQYDNKSTLTHVVQRQVADELLKLEQGGFLGRRSSMLIVAHSAGGVIAEGALRYLQDPQWMGEQNVAKQISRAGKKQIYLEFIDSPRDGFGPRPGFFSGIIRWFMRAFKVQAYLEMNAYDTMLERLHNNPLQGVEIRAHFAHRPTGAFLDFPTVDSVPELDATELASFTRFVLRGTIPTDPQQRNFALSLQRDVRFKEFRVEFMAALRAKGIDPALVNPSKDVSDILIKTYRKVMPTFLGTHADIISRPSVINMLSRRTRELQHRAIR